MEGKPIEERSATSLFDAVEEPAETEEAENEEKEGKDE